MLRNGLLAIAIIGLFLMLTVGCTSKPLTPVVTASSTLSPSETPHPTSTPSQTATASSTATATPLPSATPTLTPTSTPHPLASLNMRIVFASDRDAKTGIYVAGADGTQAQRLTDKQLIASFPALSSNGERIAFVSDIDGTNELYVMNTDSHNVTRITKNGKATTPAWSPDGKRLAFVSDRNGNQQIFIINSDGTGEYLLTNNKFSNVSPAWSPDGQWIAFSGARAGNPDIYIVHPNGTGLKQITFSKRYDGDAVSWSPDSKWLIFPSDRIGNYELYMTNLNGSVLYRLTETEDDEFYGVLSPDSHYLLTKVFDKDGSARITIRDLDSRKVFDVANAALDASVLFWLSDTRPSAFDSTVVVSSVVTDSICIFSNDKTYGYSAENPISIGNGPKFGGPFDGFYVFTWLRGANGESFDVIEPKGSLGNSKGDVLHVYTLVAPNGKQYNLYVNGSDYSIPQIPMGFQCDLRLP